jgi:hypothetical protein
MWIVTRSSRPHDYIAEIIPEADWTAEPISSTASAP